MFCLSSSINIPVAEWDWMCLSARGGRSKKQVQAVLGLDLVEVGAVRAQVEKQRLVVGGNTLANDCNAESPRGQRWLRDGCLQVGAVIRRSFAKGIELVRAPQIGG